MGEYKNNVLFVDDEVNILSAIRRSVRSEKYNTFFAKSGIEALEIIGIEDIHVIVTDMRMPSMSGLDLLKILRDTHPRMVKIVLSGYAQLPQVLSTVNQVDVFKFITKPWDSDNELKKIVNDAVYIYNYEKENVFLRESIDKKNELYQKLLRSYDEKILGIKRDFQAVFRIQNQVTEYLIDLNTKRSNNLISQIHYSEVLSQVNKYNKKFENAYPSEKISVAIKVLEDYLFELKEGSLDKNAKLNISNSSDINKVVRVNIKLLNFLFKIILEDLFIITEENYEINADVEKEYSKDRDMWLKINFRLANLSMREDENIELNALHLLLIEAIINRFDGELTISNSEKKSDISFKLSLRID